MLQIGKYKQTKQTSIIGCQNIEEEKKTEKKNLTEKWIKENKTEKEF